MDILAGVRDTGCMLEPGRLRERLARILGAAFAEGLLSEQTLSYRLELLFGSPLVEPHCVIGDLALRAHAPRRMPASVLSTLAAARSGLARVLDRRTPEPRALVLALDWSGARGDLVIGRGTGCDVALMDRTVSRRHARLFFRDGRWIIQDLASKNGIALNGAQVGRSQLRPGDRLAVGLQLIDID
jgi:FHA domain